MRVISTASSNLPGTLETRGEQIDELRGEDYAQGTHCADDDDDGGDEVRQAGGVFAATFREVLGKGRDEGAGECTFGEQIPR